MANKTTATGAAIESRTEYKNTKEGQASLWHDEINASKKMLTKFAKTGDKVVKRFLGHHSANETAPESQITRLNLFHSNVTTVESTMFGQVPKIDVSRRFTDADDDAARVASEMMERLLNIDLNNNSESYDAVMRGALQDRLLAGLGTARVRYDVQTAEVEGEEQVISEDAPLDYVYWNDVLWSWSRNWADLRWIAFRNYLTKDEIEAKFGKEAAEGISLKNQQTSPDDNTTNDPNKDGAWLKGEIWEIWDKEKREVVWVALGYDKVLKTQKDPLKLKNFFPCPPFFLANPTTQLYMPTADFKLSQDLYNEIDKLQQRISIITEAVKVVGVYNSAASNLTQMFQSGTDNDLIPVDNWALFGENGGIAGQIEWVPIADVVNALDKLRELRAENIQLLQQVTGMSDVSRGALDNQYEALGQTQLKAQMGSVRMKALQEQFATFATGLMALKAEVISRHFDAKTIVQMSNMQHSLDKDLIPQAVALIKDTKSANLRVEIRAESLAMEDMSALKAERSEYLNALATFMQSAAPLMAEDPAAKPFLLKMLQWTLAGFKGSYEIEGVLDKAIEASLKEAKEKAQNPQPDPEQQKLQMAQQMAAEKGQQELAKIQAKAQADSQLRDQDLQADISTNVAAHQAKMAEIQASLQAKLTEIQAKMQSDIVTEQAQSQSNAQQAAMTAGAEVQKASAVQQLDLNAEGVKTALKIQEMAAASEVKIKEMQIPTPTPKSTDGDKTDV